MHHVSEISSIIQDHVEGLTVFEVYGLFNAPHVFLISLPFPCIHYKTNKQTNKAAQNQSELRRFLLWGDGWNVGGVIVPRHPCDVEPQWRTPPMLSATSWHSCQQQQLGCNASRGSIHHQHLSHMISDSKQHPTYITFLPPDATFVANPANMTN